MRDVLVLIFDTIWASARDKFQLSIWQRVRQLPWLPASRYLTWTQNRCPSDVTHATDVVYDVA